MRLSEAMMLGSTTCKMIPNDWNSCALGAAGNAVGIPQANKKVLGQSQICPDGNLRIGKIGDAFPWLLDNYHAFMGVIYHLFDRDVCEGKMTFEQLIDYVRSIEPECGECCKFECSCVKQAAAIPVAELVTPCPPTTTQ
jgi:hypothetical protein